MPSTNKKFNRKCSNKREVKITVSYLENIDSFNTKEKEIIIELQKLPIAINKGVSETYIEQLALLQKEKFTQFVISLHWFYKLRFNENHVIPVYKIKGFETYEEVANVYKPWGEMYASIFDMCFEIYAISKITEINNISDPYELFKNIIFEIRNAWIIAPIHNENIATTKKAYILQERKNLEGLKDLKNTINFNEFPYLHSLLESVISIYHTDRAARKMKKFYTAYLKGYRRAINHLDKYFYKLVEHKGKIYRIEIGNSKKLLSIKDA